MTFTITETVVTRTPEQFAIEHAEYMAKDAECLLTALSTLAELTHEDLLTNDVDAQTAVSEATTGLRSGIYEFRKRAARCSRSPNAASVDALTETIARTTQWMHNATLAAGYPTGTPFDVVWAETLAKAQAAARLDPEIFIP